MTTWRYSGNNKVSLKQKLLTHEEFNFTNKYLWKLPEISSKFKSISPVFSPSRIRDYENLRTRKSVYSNFSGDQEKMPQLKIIESCLNEKPPHFLIEGTQKVYTKQYFRKTFLEKIRFPKQTPQKVRKVSASNDTELDAWEND
jgi:hypothetical protein